MEKNQERVEIGCYTKMSELKGIASVKEYIEEAMQRGWKAIGIADNNSTQSFIEAQEYMERKEIKNLKILFGTRVQVEENNILIIVKQQKGLKNLYTLLSQKLTGNEITKSDLEKYREGLLYGTGGTEGELYKRLYNAKEEKLDEIAKFYDFIQIEPLLDETPKMQEINQKLIELGRKNDSLVIASSNPIFVQKEDAICGEILNHANRIKDYGCDRERYLHTTKEMLEKWDYLDEKIAYEITVTNTNKLADLCEEINVIVENIGYPKIENSENIIREKCEKKVKEIYKEEIPEEVKQRLDLELTSILKNKYEFIYLLASDVVKKSNEMGYLVGARGSVRMFFCCIFIRHYTI